LKQTKNENLIPLELHHFY